ncbi:hypothetical protein XELAEV_18033673mg [Xenopus laevis]|uniref:Uncharacterized protein n=1 Tax=Xenopus laevis TaxID=8355 RepID=A0A974HEM7_XENLA|nr:hypothetical protein XELAEV_18033673mg [Xenopus laevis]
MTFVYSEADITRITGMIKPMDNFLSKPDAVTEFKELEKVKRKCVAFEVHQQTLVEYIKCNRIPRGLRSHLRPTMFARNESFCQKWETILNKCSLDLMVVIVEEIQGKLPTLM